MIFLRGTSGRAMFGVAVALSVAASTAAAQNGTSIVMRNFNFSPMSIAIAPGTTVTWQNLDDEPHTVVSVDGLFRSGALDQDEKFAFKFDRPGTYKFVCSIHPKMTGIIVVK